MRLGLDHPALLVLLLLGVPALRGAGATWRIVGALPPSSGGIPVQDGISRLIDFFLRALGAVAVTAIVLGLAGLHRSQTTRLRQGTGAHIVLVLDRSLSMDEPFALVGKVAVESKTAASSRLIGELFARRPHDAFGVVAFSTQPIQVMPLTPDRGAVQAALRAMRGKALANTDIGGGLTAGLAMFAQDQESGARAARVLLLVSDGAGIIPPETQDYLRVEALRQRVHIYYLYLRAGDEPPLRGDPTAGDDAAKPAGLDTFFASLGVPYRGFEADDPGAVAAATHIIDGLESGPSLYVETVPRLPLDRVCYACAALCLTLLLLAQSFEREMGEAALR